jgi:methyl-accepting chemotaxis protein
MGSKIKRQKFPLINKSIQYKFLAIVVIYGSIIAISMATALFLPDIIAMNNENLSQEMRTAAAQRTIAFHSRVWPSLITLVCIFALHSFRVLLRIFGPLYRFRVSFPDIGKGNLALRVKLRKKDYLKEEAEKFNEMLDVFREKWGNVQSYGQEALESLSALEKGFKEGSDGIEDYQKLLEEHRTILEEVMSQAQYFRLTDEVKEQQPAAPQGE